MLLHDLKAHNVDIGVSGVDPLTLGRAWRLCREINIWIWQLKSIQIVTKSLKLINSNLHTDKFNTLGRMHLLEFSKFWCYFTHLQVGFLSCVPIVCRSLRGSSQAGGPASCGRNSGQPININEPTTVGLCVQGIFQAFSGISNSLIGFRKLKSMKSLKSYKITSNNYRITFGI